MRYPGKARFQPAYILCRNDTQNRMHIIGFTQCANIHVCFGNRFHLMKLAFKLFQRLLFSIQLITYLLHFRFDTIDRRLNGLQFSNWIKIRNSGIFLFQVQILHNHLDAALQRGKAGGGFLPGARSQIFQS